ncbi:MAG: hypothetical protein KAS16_05305 [Thermoplasmata archaeon]|nr:hypothetical protein [Thermoplasmata archaeon]
MAASVLPRLPGLLIKFLWAYMRFKRKMKRSARAMKKGMIKNGMDRKLAKKLAEAYEIDFSLRKLMKGQGINIPGFSNFFN